MSFRGRRRSNRAPRAALVPAGLHGAVFPSWFRRSSCCPRLEVLLALFIADRTTSDIRFKLFPHLAHDAHTMPVHSREVRCPKFRTLAFAFAREFFRHPHLDNHLN